jgi:hypothetical protein
MTLSPIATMPPREDRRQRRSPFPKLERRRLPKRSCQGVSRGRLRLAGNGESETVSSAGLMDRQVAIEFLD